MTNKKKSTRKTCSTHEELLMCIRMLEEGKTLYQIKKICGVNRTTLRIWWAKYQKYGPECLKRKKTTTLPIPERVKAIQEYEKNKLSLLEILVKYDISECAFMDWRKRYASGGVNALLRRESRKPPEDMGRLKKKTVEEMTELERLQQENLELKTEVALLKKVKALVEEREARLKGIGRKPSRN